MPFFAGCILYNFFPGHMGAAGPAVLRFLVFAGALLQVPPPPPRMPARLPNVNPCACASQRPCRISSNHIWRRRQACTGETCAGPALNRDLIPSHRVCFLGFPQIFGKGAKFSMFKPAEEMVYIGLDEESRTKGKAAIDVVGAQSGKSLGSVLQQALLLATGGALAGV